MSLCSCSRCSLRLSTERALSSCANEIVLCSSLSCVLTLLGDAIDNSCFEAVELEAGVEKFTPSSLG